MIMKRVLFMAIAIIAAATVVGCASKERWNDEHRRELRDEVGAWREMVYLENLDDAEFEDFSGDVVEAIEIDYPIYTTFVELPAKGDTVEVYVVSTIVNRLQTDAHNMRNIYPYPLLVSEGILPPGLDIQAQRAFYDCFTRRVNANFKSVGDFFNALVDDTAPDSKIEQMQQQCASDLFDWNISEDETIFFD